MDRAGTLALFDREMRADPPSEAGFQVERLDRVTRLVGDEGLILYSDLDGSTALPAVEEQASYFRSSGKKVEWKLFGHDRPADLAQTLASAGFAAQPSETLMVFDMAEGSLPVRPVEGVDVRTVRDPTSLGQAVEASRAAFGPEGGWTLEDYLPRLSDPSMVIQVAYAGEEPIAAGRLEMPVGRSFASLWGGGTAPTWRGRGIYQWLTASRAQLARARGYRFLTVDALPTSQPILERVGFLPLVPVQGWVLGPSSP